jgi:hypothetical protein
LLSQSSDEELVRKRGNLNVNLTDEDEEESEQDGEMERMSFKTPVSERLKLESMSVFYSKGLYPISLGMIHEQD